KRKIISPWLIPFLATLIKYRCTRWDYFMRECFSGWMHLCLLKSLVIIVMKWLSVMVGYYLIFQTFDIGLLSLHHVQNSIKDFYPKKENLANLKGTKNYKHFTWLKSQPVW
ncbi:hypothetical protein ACJX0J_012853, partial [Zea mays]